METYTTNNIPRQRLTQTQKDANDKQWYKDHVNMLDARSLNTGGDGYGGISEYRRKKVNYDLFNNIINLRDFEYVCKPYGSEVGEMPATLTNRDITSGKIKSLLGMEMKRPFSWKAIAVNPEATTRKEEEYFKRLKDYTVEQILAPIRQKIQQAQAQQTQGQQLTPEQQTQLQKEAEQQLQAQTPDEVKKYMAREHQDPAEVQSGQILRYLIQKERIPQKFNRGFKHAMLGGEELFWVGIVNGEPTLRVVNTIDIKYSVSPDNEFIHQGEWVVCPFKMTPSEIIAQFGDELTDEQIDDIYERFPDGGMYNSGVMDDGFDFNPLHSSDGNTFRVIHSEWKSLRKVGFLTYIDPNTGEPELKIVSEEYRKNKTAGDVDLKWEWIPEKHEGWKIADNIYVGMGPVPGQHIDLDNLYECKLSYIGAAYDNLNSQVTSIMDRMKPYQYYYNIIMYRLEMLIASDRGKKVFANINMVPTSAGIDLKKWSYYLDSTSMGWFNPGEEGHKKAGGANDIVSHVKEIDLSTVSQINHYVELLEYIERRCGDSVGIPKQVEGQIGPNDAVTNTQQTIVQSSHILEPYFDLHNNIKQEVLQSLIDCAKVAYSVGKPKKLSFVLDDMSMSMFEIDQEMLENSTMGIFVTNSTKADETKQLIGTLAHAAMQNGLLDLSSVVKVVRSEGVVEAEEELELGEQKKADQNQQNQMQLQQAQSEEAQAQRDHEKAGWEHDLDKIRLKAQLDGQNEINKQLILSAGFDPDKDEDNDGTPDILELAKHGVDANISLRHQALEEDKFKHQQTQDEHNKKVDNEKLKLEAKKIEVAAKKKTK